MYPTRKAGKSRPSLPSATTIRQSKSNRKKGNTVSIPYAEIYKFSYEYTKRHRVNEESIFAAAVGVGAIVMLTHSKSHWLEIDYRVGDVPKSFVLRMDKRDYIHILDAVKAHTGMDAEVLGNANKR